MWQKCKQCAKTHKNAQRIPSLEHDNMQNSKFSEYSLMIHSAEHAGGGDALVVPWKKNMQKYAKMRKMQYFFKTTIFDLEEFQGSRWENKPNLKRSLVHFGQ